MRVSVCAFGILLAVVGAATQARAELLLSEQQLQIVLIGSSDAERKEYIDAASRTVAKLFKQVAASCWHDASQSLQ